MVNRLGEVHGVEIPGRGRFYEREDLQGGWSGGGCCFLVKRIQNSYKAKVYLLPLSPTSSFCEGRGTLPPTNTTPAVIEPYDPYISARVKSFYTPRIPTPPSSAL